MNRIALLMLAAGLAACSPAPNNTTPPSGQPPAEGEVTVRGTLTAEGVECQALRGDDGQLYTLAGGAPGFETGARVEVRGTVAAISTCMQGTTLEVASITAAPAP